MRLPHFLQIYLRDRSFCSGLIDVLHYEQAARTGVRRLFTIHVKQLGEKAVFCRGGTSDATVLRTTFFNQYDAPPVPLPLRR